MIGTFEIDFEKKEMYHKQSDVFWPFGPFGLVDGNDGHGSWLATNPSNGHTITIRVTRFNALDRIGELVSLFTDWSCYSLIGSQMFTDAEQEGEPEQELDPERDVPINLASLDPADEMPPTVATKHRLICIEGTWGTLQPEGLVERQEYLLEKVHADGMIQVEGVEGCWAITRFKSV
jgi:hypothetical protein